MLAMLIGQILCVRVHLFVQMSAVCEPGKTAEPQVWDESNVEVGEEEEKVVQNIPCYCQFMFEMLIEFILLCYIQQRGVGPEADDHSDVEDEDSDIDVEMDINNDDPAAEVCYFESNFFL